METQAMEWGNLGSFLIIVWWVRSRVIVMAVHHHLTMPC